MMPKHREVKQLIQGHTAGPKWPGSRAHLAITNRPSAQRTYLRMANSVTAESHMGLNPTVIFSCAFATQALLLSVASDVLRPRHCSRQAPPSMGFPRQECWSGLPLPSLGDLPDPRPKPMSPAWQTDPLPGATWEDPGIEG